MDQPQKSADLDDTLRYNVAATTQQHCVLDVGYNSEHTTT